MYRIISVTPDRRLTGAVVNVVVTRRPGATRAARHRPSSGQEEVCLSFVGHSLL